MKAFGRLLRMEMSRALSSPPFVVSLTTATLLAITLAVMQGSYYVDIIQQATEHSDTVWSNPFAHGAYSEWLPMVSVAPLANLFFLILPLLCSTAYGWSLRSDLDGGYAASLITRCGSLPFYSARSCAVFLCGGLVVALPLIANYLALLCFLPAYHPSVSDVIYTGIWFKTLCSDLFYTNPPIYMIARTMLDFILGGLWACVSLSVSQALRNKLAIVVIPLLMVMVIQTVWTTVASLQATILGIDQTWSSITILNHLRSRGDALFYNGWALLFDIALLVVIAAAGTIAFRRRELV